MAGTILYVDMWKGERIQEMKLAGIRRYAGACGWTVEICSERQSRPKPLKSILARLKPQGCIVEASAAHTDLPPRVFGKIPVVYLDGLRSLYGGRVPKVVHDGEATTRVAFKELASNHPQAYAVVGYRDCRFWSRIREVAFRSLATATGKPFFAFVRRDESGASRAARLVEWARRLPLKCAVFAANDNTAAEVVAACCACGRRIPTDVTLLGTIMTRCSLSKTRILGN